MRPTSLIPAVLMMTLGTAPAAAQLHASIRIGPIRIGANLPIVDRYHYPRYVNVHSYSSNRYGDWRRSAPYWQPVTLYFLSGRYYERPYRNARRVEVYRYRDQYFRAPTGRDWDRGRARYRDDDRRDDRRVDRGDRRDDRRGGRGDRRNDGRRD